MGRMMKINCFDNTTFSYGERKFKINDKQNKLIFLGFVNEIKTNALIKVKCECGEERLMRFIDFYRRSDSSYNCCSHKDLIGKTFSNLVVEDFAGHNYRNKIRFRCRCVCGQEVIALKDDLKSGSKVSCGCHRIKSAEHIEYVKYRRNAKFRKIPFEISLEHFQNLIHQPCYYCGDEPSRKIKNLSKQERLIKRATVNGIDRLDSMGGYCKNNIVSCCYKCNTAKMDLSITDFFSLINKIYNYRIKQGDQTS
jgi:hypothetical protein